MSYIERKSFTVVLICKHNILSLCCLFHVSQYLKFKNIVPLFMVRLVSVNLNCVVVDSVIVSVLISSSEVVCIVEFPIFLNESDNLKYVSINLNILGVTLVYLIKKIFILSILILFIFMSPVSYSLSLYNSVYFVLPGYKNK